MMTTSVLYFFSVCIDNAGNRINPTLKDGNFAIILLIRVTNSGPKQMRMAFSLLEIYALVTTIFMHGSLGLLEIIDTKLPLP